MPRVLGVLTAATLLAGAPAHAQDEPLQLRLDTRCPGCERASAAAQPSASEAIVLTSVNLDPKGERLVLVTPDGDILLRRGDLQSLGLRGLRYEVTRVEGVEYVSLRSVERLRFNLDLQRLELQIRVEAQALAGRQVIDLTPPRPGKVIHPAPGGGFLNYNLVATGTDSSGVHALDAAGELGVRHGEYFFVSDAIANRDRQLGREQVTRLSTSIVRDDRRTLQRLVAGDFVTTPSTLGSSLRLGGLSFSRRFSLDPYLVRFPGQIVAGTATLPSEVLLYSNGVLVRRERVQPGRFELQNLVALPGLQVTEVVVRDVLGNEQRISDPYYFSDSLLRPGLDEYSFDAGLEREEFGTRSNEYGRPGASAFYRRGITDAVTLGARGESLNGRSNLGPLAAVRLGLLGVASAAWSQGTAGGSGSAWFLGHAYSAGRFSSSVGLRREARDYPRAATSFLGNQRREFSAAFGYALGAGVAVSLVHLDAQAWESDRRRSSAVTLRQRLSAALSWSTTVRRSNDPLVGTEMLFGLAYSFDALGQTHSAYGQTLRNREARIDTLQLTGGNPDAAGLYYRASLDRTRDPAGTRETLYPLVQYSFPAAVARGEYFRDSGSGTDTYRAGVAGALANVQGHWGLARPISDSFGIAKLGDIEDVRVYANNTLVGRTGADGTIFIPRLASYFDNPVAIEDKDLPADAIVPEVRYVVSPPLRSGVLLDFRPRRVRAVAGRLLAPRAPAQPFGGAEGELVVDGQARPLYVSNDGRFYVEDVGPGEHRGRARRDGQECAFLVSVPGSKDPVVELGAIQCQ